MKKHLLGLGAVVAAASLTLVTVLTGGPATGSPIAHTAVVSPNPSDLTPRVQDGAVYKMLQLGGIMFAGGQFSQVKPYTNAGTINRNRLFGFNPVTGGLTAFQASFNSEVWALATDGRSLWVGGYFNSVNGVPRTGVVKLNPYTGAVDPAFNARLTGSVTDMAIVKGRLILGGTFSKKLIAVNPATGGDTGYIKLAITGAPGGTNAGQTKVFRFAPNPAGTRLAIVGTFTSVGGQARRQAAMINLGASSATVSGWYSPLFDKACYTATPTYSRDVDFSHDGTYFVIVTTGGGFPNDRTHLCDSATRWNTSDARTTYPVWANYTGGDTLLSVQVTRAAVYVQGHQRWMNNPGGRDFAGPGAVSRPGIAALNPHSGLAYSWNPTKDRGVGGYDLLLTAQGLWVASDTTHIGGEVHERIAFLPLP
ncbi:beta-propeller uncharacterized protein DUF5122 [Kribbella amoyensis]|uniref:Beta-propeller uncharacterized protein DUF5122 n=1 Tax=Kribbella amoyensis TaxID=996641 RepID=A0A561B8R6_9ACTN|nr:delta-60 repeat domain-containing protein [Kribbella amoyensis]TWD75355.1 beta-propeller uncharacterized protein DUF5122 [Kribbella amoyensis]